MFIKSLKIKRIKFLMIKIILNMNWYLFDEYFPKMLKTVVTVQYRDVFTKR